MSKHVSLESRASNVVGRRVFMMRAHVRRACEVLQGVKGRFAHLNRSKLGIATEFVHSPFQRNYITMHKVESDFEL
jgi:hypothetical protein